MPFSLSLSPSLSLSDLTVILLVAFMVLNVILIQRALHTVAVILTVSRLDLWALVDEYLSLVYMIKCAAPMVSTMRMNASSRGTPACISSRSILSIQSYAN